MRQLRSIALIALAPAVLAQNPPTAKAADELREAATDHWNAQEYRSASLKLQRAEKIYRELNRGPDVAAVLRAIVWNESHVDLDEALRWLNQLAAVVVGDPRLAFELSSGYDAVYTAASNGTTTEAKIAPLLKAREGFRQVGLTFFAAQVLHDVAGFYGRAGALDQMNKRFRQAIAERESIGDYEGIGWSRNNTAFHYLHAGRPEDALRPLEQVFESIANGDIKHSQAAVAVNLDTLAASIEQSAPDRAVVDWWWRHAQRYADRPLPFVFTPDRMLRTALRADTALRGASAAAARRAVGIAANAGWPDEVRADISLRAAAVALAGSAPKVAAELLEDVDVGKGPCAPHLAARKAALQAAIAAADDDSAAFDRRATAAYEAMKDLGDRAGTLATLERVTEREPDGSSTFEQLVGWRTDLRRQGELGGDGGTAQVLDVGEVPVDAAEHTPAFELSWYPERQSILIEDLLGGSKWAIDLRWKPQLIARNGLGLELFGGYVTVRSMSYGGSIEPGTALGQTTLDQLGNYVPITADGVWQVTLNGAVRHVER